MSSHGDNQSKSKSKSKSQTQSKSQSQSQSNVTPAVRERLVYGFNTFYGDMLSSIAKSDELLKKRLKKCYRVLDRKSDAYLVDFYRSAKENEVFGRVFDDGNEGDDGLAGLMVARGLKYGDVPEAEFPTVRLLCAFAWLFGELCSAAEEPEEDREAAVTAVNELFERLIEGVSRIQSGLSWGSGLEGLMDDEARDIFRATFTKLADAARENASSAASAAPGGAGAGAGAGAGDPDEIAGAFDMMQCSKLGSIVKEISESIDKDALRQAVQSGDMLSGNNVDMMSNLFKQVSGAITGKLQSGELDQDDLLRETTQLMGSMKGMM